MTYLEAEEYYLLMEEDRKALVNKAVSQGFNLGSGFRATEIEVMLKMLEKSLKADCYFAGKGFNLKPDGRFLTPQI